MPTVANPPALVAQETGAWCFAAAEVMVRNYYNVAASTQYAIARRQALLLAESDSNLEYRWVMAESSDMGAQRNEAGGTNLNSEIVQLVRAQRNVFNDGATGGRIIPGNLTPQLVRDEIDANRIFVIGTDIHYYVVYGYTTNGMVMNVRDPWPPNQGGMKTEIRLNDFLRSSETLVSFF